MRVFLLLKLHTSHTTDSVLGRHTETATHPIVTADTNIPHQGGLSPSQKESHQTVGCLNAEMTDVSHMCYSTQYCPSVTHL